LTNIKNKRPAERDQQKWLPVLRPIALQIKRAHDLIAKPLTLWRIMRRAGRFYIASRCAIAS